MLTEDTFIWIMDADSNGSLESHIMEAQNQYTDILDRDLNLKHYTCTKYQQPGTFMWKSEEGKFVIPLDNDICHAIMKTWHDLPTAGHPRRDEMIRRVTCKYHWPGARH